MFSSGLRRKFLLNRMLVGALQCTENDWKSDEDAEMTIATCESATNKPLKTATV